MMLFLDGCLGQVTYSAVNCSVLSYGPCAFIHGLCGFRGLCLWYGRCGFRGLCLGEISSTYHAPHYALFEALLIILDLMY